MKANVTASTLAALISLTLGPGAARADDAKPVVEHPEPDGYGYLFEDDLLDADGSSYREALIQVRPGASRVLLIRPRLHFLDRLAQSTERL